MRYLSAQEKSATSHRSSKDSKEAAICKSSHHSSLQIVLHWLITMVRPMVTPQATKEAQILAVMLTRCASKSAILRSIRSMKASSWNRQDSRLTTRRRLKIQPFITMYHQASPTATAHFTYPRPWLRHLKPKSMLKTKKGAYLKT